MATTASSASANSTATTETKTSKPGSIKMSEFKYDGAQLDFEMDQLNRFQNECKKPIWNNPNNEDLKLNNRYTNVLPYKDDRVKLGGDANGMNGYINASHVKAPESVPAKVAYIAAQAPIQATFPSWWQMVWEQSCPVILMLTKFTEGNRLKAHRYWPDKVAMEETYGRFRVKLVSEKDLPPGGLTERQFELTSLDALEKKTSEPTRKIIQYQYTDWPDHGVPTNKDIVQTLFTEYRKHRTTKAPALVHCSAGIGRTGTFISLDMLLDTVAKAVASKTPPENTTFNILEIAKGLRDARPGMIQTKEQYKFIYEFLDHALKTKMVNAEIAAQKP